jgi:hypothetical protein
MREGDGDLREFSVILLSFNEKNQILLLDCVPCLSCCIVSDLGVSAAVYLPRVAGRGIVFGFIVFASVPKIFIARE